MDLPLGTMLLTSYATSMYRNIKTFPSLNQIAQYFNGQKKNTFTSQHYDKDPSPDV